MFNYLHSLVILCKKSLKIYNSKDRQQNGQKKNKDKRTNNDMQNTTQKPNNQATRTPLKIGEKLRKGKYFLLH